MNVSQNDFSQIVTQVIDKMEGGYYHPQMLADGRVKDSRYGSSGETMFGIDRKAGGAINTTPAGQKFWGMIDDAGAAGSWSWNYKGGNLNGPLKDLAAQVMYPVFIQYSNSYLSPEAQAIVQSDPRLLFHFGYAAWNGPGWFKKFAAPINAAVASGNTNPAALVQIAVDSRLTTGNSLITQGGNKIAGFINDMMSMQISGAKAGIAFVKKHQMAFAIGFGVALMIGVGVALYFTVLKKKG